MNGGMFEDLVGRWVQSQPWSPRSRQAYEMDLRNLGRWCNDNEIDPEAVTAGDLMRYFKHLDRGKDRPATRNRRLSSIRMYHDWLVAQRLRPDNPAQGIARIREPKTWRNAVTMEELRALLDAASDPQDRATIALLGVNGLVVSEISAAVVADLRRDEEPIRLLIQGGRQAATRQPGQRYTLLPSVTADPLLQALGDRASGPLLQSRRGSTVNQRSVGLVIRRAAKRAGLDRAVTSSMLTNCFRLTAIQSGFSFSSIARALPGSDLRALMPHVPLDGPVEEHAAMRMATLITEDRQSDSALLAQSERLLAQPDVDPVASVAIAASVLERHLRNLARARSVSPDDERKANLSVYAHLLRRAKVIENHDNDGIMRVLRARDAADHGWFDEVDASRAASTISLVREILASCRIR